MWRRLVARYLGVVEAAGSNPVTQTKSAENLLRFSALFFGSASALTLVGEVGRSRERLVGGRLKFSRLEEVLPKVLQNSIENLPGIDIAFMQAGFDVI